LALRDARELDVDPRPAARRHLRGAARQPRGPHVLDADDRTGAHHLEARLEQELLGEWIADLDGRATLLGLLVERRRRHRGAVDPVAAGLVADVEDRVAWPFRARPENLIAANETDAHHVDERVARVFRCERDLAADGGAAETVAVPADARHDA